MSRSSCILVLVVSCMAVASMVDPQFPTSEIVVTPVQAVQPDPNQIEAEVRQVIQQRHAPVSSATPSGLPASPAASLPPVSATPLTDTTAQVRITEVTPVPATAPVTTGDSSTPPTLPDKIFFSALGNRVMLRRIDGQVWLSLYWHPIAP